MKNMLFLVFALLCFTQTVRAQRFGVEGGPNILWGAIGLHIGPVAEFPLSGKLSIKPGLFYSEKGYVLTGPYAPFVKMNYLELPVLLVYKMPLNKKGLKLDFDFGPNTGYMIDHSSLTHHPDGFDYGIKAGFGFEKGVFSLGMNFNIGFNNLFGPPFKHQNRVFQISAAFMFGKKKKV
jgi:hypothetical protein